MTATTYGSGSLPPTTQTSSRKKSSSVINEYPITFISVLLILFGGTIVFFAVSGKHIINSHFKSTTKSFEVDKENSNLYQKVLNDDGYTESALADLHLTLPGIEDMESIGFLSFSGYLTITDIDGIEKDMFYWFVESKNDPDNDPLLLWTNGGPGCSGMVGMLTEHGPFWTNPDEGLYLNERSWNSVANIFYVEQPYGVGYSQAINSEATSGDEKAAYQMYQMILTFLETYPKYKSNDFYLSAESWGGHYMPWTAKTILEELETNEDAYINFKGFIVGNPYTNDDENSIGWMRALYGHGLLTNELWNDWSDSCVTAEEIEDSDMCEWYYIESIEQGGDIDFYGLDYPECLDDSSSTFSKIINNKDSSITSDNDISTTTTSYKSFKTRFLTKLLQLRLKKAVSSDILSDEQKQKAQDRLDNLDTYMESLKKNHKKYNSKRRRTIAYGDNDNSEPFWECVTDYTLSYLNRADVQAALHVIDSVDSDTITWSECSDEVYDNWPEIEWYTHMEYIYEELMTKYDIRITIVSGDDDSVCGTEGTEWWMDLMNWEKDDDFNHYIWTDVQGQVGGYYTRFLKPGTTDQTGLHFITVRSAGHMIPFYQPERSLTVFKYFLNDFADITEDASN